MRKTFILGIAIATAMGFSSCEKENLQQTAGLESKGLITETIQASFQGQETKTSYKPGKKPNV